MLEFLLQNGAQWQHKDAHGRTPLHYALLHNAPATAKQLLRRGAVVAGVRVGRGNTALDLVMARGRVSDEELFVLLSGS
jgi:ankyrin repeat protein